MKKDPETERRRRRLRAYLKQYLGGVEAELARKIGRSPSQTSDMLAGRKSFGAAVARDIEKKLELPRLYLDQDEDPTATAQIPLTLVPRPGIRAALEILRPLIAPLNDDQKDVVVLMLGGWVRNPDSTTTVAVLEMMFASPVSNQRVEDAFKRPRDDAAANDDTGQGT